jgi:Spy/CpxP family protein refolding chaperone
MGSRMLNEILSLTEEQKAQIKEIMQAHRKDFREHHKKGRGKKDCEGLHEKRKALHDQIHDEIMAILDPEQQAVLKSIREQFDRGEVPTEIIDHRIKRLTEELALTPEQQEQIKAIMAENGKKLLAKRGDCKGHRKGRRHGMKMKKGADGAIMAVLTEEQKQAFQALLKERREHMKEHMEHRKEHRMERRLDHLTKALDLSGEQQEQLKQILEGSREEMMNAFKGAEDKDARHEAMKAYHEELEKQIKAILTAEQQAKFDELKEKRKEQHCKHGPKVHKS